MKPEHTNIPSKTPDIEKIKKEGGLTFPASHQDLKDFEPRIDTMPKREKKTPAIPKKKFSQKMIEEIKSMRDSLDYFFTGHRKILRKVDQIVAEGLKASQKMEAEMSKTTKEGEITGLIDDIKTFKAWRLMERVEHPNTPPTKNWQAEITKKVAQLKNHGITEIPMMTSVDEAREFLNEKHRQATKDSTQVLFEKKVKVPPEEVFEEIEM